MKNFFQRAITAAAFVAVLLSCTFYSHITFTALFTLITLLGTWEFYKLVEKDGATRPQRVMGAVTAGVMFVTNAVFSMTQMNIRVLLFIFPFIFSIFIIEWKAIDFIKEFQFNSLESVSLSFNIQYIITFIASI